MPEPFLRLRLLKLLTIHRPLIVQGAPSEESGLLLTADHPGFIDGPLLALAVRRPLLFGVDPDYAHKAPWNQLLRVYATLFGHAFVSLSPTEPFALRTLGRHLDVGGAVCLFPEGAVRRGGPPRPWGTGARWLAHRARLWQHVTLAGTEGGILNPAPLRLVFASPRAPSSLYVPHPDQPLEGSGCVPSSRRSKSSTATISSTRS